MLDLIYWLFLLFSFFYLIIVLLTILGLSRLKVKRNSDQNFVSVVIAARNEESRILPTLKSLEKLNYPLDKYEIIIIDDASTDNTASVIDSYANKHGNWKLIRFANKSSELRGKKKALKEAINQAKGEIVFTTDADCQVPPNWLQIMSEYFDNQTAMVLGHSPIKPGKGFWNKILEFDNLFSAIVGAAPTKLGFSLTSVGRNLAYRKSIYQNVGGFDALKKFKSGDDVHLTERFRRRGNGKIDYCAHPETFVITIPPSTKREIFHQQIRKNSKTLNKSIPAVLLSLFLLMIFLLFSTLPMINMSWFGLWFYVIIGRFSVEFIALTQASIIFHKKKLIPYLLLMQAIYPFYIMFFSLLGILQIYEWKK